jgi:hypothetical protein
MHINNLMTNFISMASVFFTEAGTKRKWAVVPHTWPRIPSTKLGLQSWRTQQCWTCKHGVHNFRPKAYEITDFLRNNTKFKGVIVVTVAIVMLVRCCLLRFLKKETPNKLSPPKGPKHLGSSFHPPFSFVLWRKQDNQVW